ncbi:hypothetical protein BRADI_3g24793v3, partial [Brachypodium distachyon]
WGGARRAAAGGAVGRAGSGGRRRRTGAARAGGRSGRSGQRRRGARGAGGRGGARTDGARARAAAGAGEDGRRERPEAAAAAKRKGGRITAFGMGRGERLGEWRGENLTGTAAKREERRWQQRTPASNYFLTSAKLDVGFGGSGGEKRGLRGNAQGFGENGPSAEK